MSASDTLVCGWDIGGAHLKLVAVDDARRVRALQVLACPLWQGMSHLEQALAAALDALPVPPRLHALTMTGEGCDLFADRSEGVARIRDVATAALGAPLVYAGARGLVREAAAADVASMNWHAMGAALAAHVHEALLVDVGSTTSDLLPIRGGRLVTVGHDDRTRLASEALVYQGIARTPVMALAGRVPYRGAWQGLAAEYFATTADVYRLLGELPPDADLLPSADGRPKSVGDSAARLARMVGDDLGAADLPAVRDLARWLRGAQLMRLRDAALRVTEGRLPPLVVGAGVGRFLVRDLARALGLAYADYAQALGYAHAPQANDCAPALAVASLGLAP